MDGNPSEERYQALHHALFAMGLRLYALGANASAPAHFTMPHGTYFGELEATVLQVRDLVTERAIKINKPRRVVVFVAETINWAGWGYTF